MSNNQYVQRRVTLDRLLDRVERGSVSLEHALGEAYGAGYLEGSCVAELAPLDAGILEVIGCTETATVESIRVIHPKLAESIDAARLAEMNLVLEAACG